jgi:hypothetical protein
VRIPLLMHAGWISAVLPVLAGVLLLHHYRRVPVTRLSVACWSLLMLIGNIVSAYLAARRQNNHWVGYVIIPLSGLAALEALTRWQVSDTARRLCRVLAPIYVVGWIAIVVLIEDTATFSLLAAPISSLLLLLVAASTVVTRAPGSIETLTKQDWFWIGMGFIIFYGVETGLPPLSLLLWKDRPDLLLVAYQLKAATMVVAMLAVTKGILCPIPLPQSGGSSSRSASPSLSSPSPLG